MLNFVNRAAAPGIRCTQVASSKVQLVFGKQLQQPVTVCAESPVEQPGKHAFEVVMPTKEGRTAIGWMAHPPVSTYMTPDYTQQECYVSMGGAGFVYPLKKHTGSKYGQHDRVSTLLELQEDGTGWVSFSVNGVAAGGAPWRHGLKAYPAISCANGEVVCEVSMHSSQ